LASIARAVLKANEPLPVADVEQYAAFARLQHHPFHRALRGSGRIGKWPECVGENVAWTQASDHLFIARRRMVDVRHQGHADLFGDLQCYFERHDHISPARDAVLRRF
jgi:hypothetical protein